MPGLLDLFAPPDDTGLLAPPRNPARLPSGIEGGILEMLAPVQEIGRALRGEMTESEAKDFAMTAAMGLLPLGRAGNAARATRKLLMDEASRMARAKEMGFFTDMPLYHGTPAPEFKAFDLAKGGSTTGAEPGRLGVWMARDPQIADEFAQGNGRKGSPRTMPLLHRADRPVQLRLSGHETNEEIAATLQDAWDKGIDAVLMKNYTSPGGKLGDILVVKNPNQVRSRFAAFDPDKIASPGLLASLMAGIGMGGLLMPESNQGGM